MKYHFKSCNNLLKQRFSIPVLAPPRSAHFLCYSHHFRRLFYSIVSALRSGHHTIFLHDSSSKRTYSIHSELKCARCEFKLYIFTDVYYVTLVCAWRCCAAQIHEWMFWSEVNFSGFPCSGSREQWTLCREQWTLCREHVNRNTVHARSALLTSWLYESGVLTKRDMQYMQSGGARGLELRTAVLKDIKIFM